MPCCAHEPTGTSPWQLAKDIPQKIQLEEDCEFFYLVRCNTPSLDYN